MSLGNVPLDIESDHPPQPDQCVAHERYAAALGCGAKEGDVQSAFVIFAVCSTNGRLLGEEVAREGGEAVPELRTSGIGLRQGERAEGGMV
jgi:hypothetical protein